MDEDVVAFEVCAVQVEAGEGHHDTKEHEVLRPTTEKLVIV